MIHFNQQQRFATRRVKKKLICLVAKVETDKIHDWLVKVRKLTNAISLRSLDNNLLNYIQDSKQMEFRMVRLPKAWIMYRGEIKISLVSFVILN